MADLKLLAFVLHLHEYFQNSAFILIHLYSQIDTYLNYNSILNLTISTVDDLKVQTLHFKLTLFTSKLVECCIHNAVGINCLQFLLIL